MSAKSLFTNLGMSSLAIVGLQGVASASTVHISAIDAYYTSFGSVSPNSGLRLLVDKASVIPVFEGLGFDSFSFLLFDEAELSELAGREYQATLTLQQETSLAETLRPPTDENPLFVSIYNLMDEFDDLDGNIDDIDYGTNGANAFSTTTVVDNGFYSWDVSSLVQGWIDEPETNNGLALSGFFGNVNVEDFNAYGIFYTVGATEGLVPKITLTPIPEPGSMLAIFALSTLGLGSTLRRKG